MTACEVSLAISHRARRAETAHLAASIIYARLGSAWTTCLIVFEFYNMPLSLPVIHPLSLSQEREVRGILPYEIVLDPIRAEERHGIWGGGGLGKHRWVCVLVHMRAYVHVCVRMSQIFLFLFWWPRERDWRWNPRHVDTTSVAKIGGMFSFVEAGCPAWARPGPVSSFLRSSIVKGAWRMPRNVLFDVLLSFVFSLLSAVSAAQRIARIRGAE